jgi:hypothetical protein
MRITIMADDKTKTGKADRCRVGCGGGYEVSYFAKKQGITVEQAMVNSFRSRKLAGQRLLKHLVPRAEAAAEQMRATHSRCHIYDVAATGPGFSPLGDFGATVALNDRRAAQAEHRRW